MLLGARRAANHSITITYINYCTADRCYHHKSQFARLERLAELEEERAAMMQRIDAEFEKKMRAMRGELMDIVDQDYRKRRETLNADAKARRNTKV
jgi:hypothetical protein